MRDDFEIMFEPLGHWPKPDTDPRSSPRFKASYDTTLRELRDEMRLVEATGPVVIKVVTRNGRSDLRRDGMLMARAQTVHPGCRVSFTGRAGALTYDSDEFESRYYGSQPDWQHNLRGIVLGLAALRAMKRYGIAGSDEQYRGWAQIEARTGSSGMSRDIALSIFVEESGLSAPMENTVRAVKLAKKNAHPDHNGNDHSRWNALTDALAVLGLGDR